MMPPLFFAQYNPTVLLSPHKDCAEKCSSVDAHGGMAGWEYFTVGGLGMVKVLESNCNDEINPVSLDRENKERETNLAGSATAYSMRDMVRSNFSLTLFLL